MFFIHDYVLRKKPLSRKLLTLPAEKSMKQVHYVAHPFYMQCARITLELVLSDKLNTLLLIIVKIEN